MIVGFIAMSLDGFIADANGSVAYLDAYDGVDSGYAPFIAGIDRLVMGRATYDFVANFGSWPYAGKRTDIVTSRPVPMLFDDCRVWNGSIDALIADLRSTPDSRSWVVGGGRLQQAFLDRDAIDELELFITPDLLGRGIPLFPGSDRPTRLELAEVNRLGPMARLKFIRPAAAG